MSGEETMTDLCKFEEPFRLQSDDETTAHEATRFVDSLLQSVRQRDVPIYVVLTMRAEYIGHSTTFTGLAESINDVDYLVPRMSVDQLRTAVKGPISVVEAQISDELVERVHRASVGWVAARRSRETAGRSR